jgi:hypothetical protein
VRVATAGRGGLPVKDRVVKTLPEGKGVGELSEEGGEEVNSLVFSFFSSVLLVNLLC